MTASLSPDARLDIRVDVLLPLARSVADAVAALATNAATPDQLLAKQLDRSPELLAHVIRLAGGMGMDETLLDLVVRTRHDLATTVGELPTYSPLSGGSIPRATIVTRSVLTARLMRALVAEYSDIAFAAGLTHDLGFLIGWEGEEVTWRTARLLAAWGLDPVACQAIALQNEPAAPTTPLARALWLARPLAACLTGSPNADELARRAEACGISLTQLESVAFCEMRPANTLGLTEMQLTVLRAVHGRSSKEAARTLGISQSTVDKHIENACKRLGVNGRKAALPLLLQAGAIPA